MRRFVLLTLILLAIAAQVHAFPVALRDSRGVSVVIKAEPHRIVSLAPSNTEILFALGLGDRIVGVTSADNYPPAARKKTQIAGPNVNVEKVVAQRPDLVIGVGTLQADLLSRLSRLGIPVLSVDPKTLRQTLDAITLIGAATGRSPQARSIRARMESKIAGVKARAAKASSWPRVFVEIWNKPLMTAGPNTFVDEMIRLAGGSNIAHDAKSGYVQFSEEALIARDPQVIITPNGTRAEILARPRWRNLSAVKSRRVIAFNPDLLVRPGPRLADGLEQLERVLHPTK